MSPIAIALLAVGIIIICVSFFIPDRDEKQTKKDTEKQREEIRRLMEGELDGMKLRVNEATNETVEYGMDKCERSLEKLANEKMMAVGEYASAVLEEIDKNHKEVLFLYDMLNDKQTDVKNTVRNAEAAAREISDAAKNANDAAANAVNSASFVKADMQSSLEEYSKRQNALLNSVQNVGAGAGGTAGSNGAGIAAGSYVNRNVGVVESVFTDYDNVASASLENAPDDNDSILTPIGALRPQDINESDLIEEPVDEFAELKNTTFNNVSNSNQQIILLNKEGKSVIEIAKQLGLGVGEVQLVLDLFK